MMARCYWKTIVRLRFSLITIAAMMALGFVTRYAGVDATLGLAFARTGVIISTLWNIAGVAGSGVDWFRYVFECSLWQPAGYFCPASGRFTHTHGSGQQLRRCHGEND